MINRVAVTNFKCLRSVDVELERFTMLVGPNASGKSSLLQALELICRIFHADIGQANQVGLESQASYGADDFVEIVGESNQYLYRLREEVPFSSYTQPSHSESDWDELGRGVSLASENPSWISWIAYLDRQLHEYDIDNFPKLLPTASLLQLTTSKLIEPNINSVADSDEFYTSVRISPDGSGLHSATANMNLNDPDSWYKLQNDLTQIIPTIRRLRHTTATQQKPYNSLLFDTIGAHALNASQVSEGTLLVLGLLTALHSPYRPGLLLLDDLDRGLHPKAQSELIQLLRTLLAANPELQIVATTHSPYMLDCMEVDEVRMTFLNNDGSTVCAPLTSHPEYPKWKDEMAPGEMWSFFGEKWIAEEVH